jgi:hypothetical protein
MIVSGTRTERWNGTSWIIVPSPKETSLYGVACTSRVHCIAVGGTHVGTATRRQAIAVWNGRVWRTQPISMPPGATDTFLDSVSCASSAACTAVGSMTVTTMRSGSVQRALAERWNGRRWVLSSGPGDTVLSSVSCISAATCVAVGPGGGTADNSTGGILAEGYS